MPTASWLRRSSEMASGKRASMGEGPLAALFRKTEEEGLHGEGVPQPAGESQARREPEARRGLRPPARAPQSRAPPGERGLRPAPPSSRGHAQTPEKVAERRERRASRSPEQ